MIAAADRHDAETISDLEAAPEAPVFYPEGCSAHDEARVEGKAKGSRWNAVRHGCMAKILIPAHLEGAVEQCTATLTEHYRPTTKFEVDAIASMGRLAAQIEMNQKMQVVDLQRTMDRAILCWDDDRSVYVDQLVTKLGRVPGVARALARSKQGAEWLLQSWMGLSDILETNGSWDDEQRRLALDMVDMRKELRNGNRLITPETEKEDLAQIVTDEVGRLEERLKRYLLATDDADRAMAAAGMPMEEDADTKRLRKQAARLKLDYRRTKAELLEGRAQAAAADAGPAPAASAAPAASTTAPVESSIRSTSDEETGPTPRPKTSSTAFDFLQKRSLLDGLDLPETAKSPAKIVTVQFPFRGGEPAAQPGSEPEPELEHVTQPVSRVEPAAVQPQTAGASSHASRAAAAKPHPDRERKLRRDQEKKARKAARRRRR
jgi:hypothetical protein